LKKVVNKKILDDAPEANNKDIKKDVKKA